MGFIDTSKVSGLSRFYNVASAVGQYCPNKPDDTRLVQYMLFHFYKHFPAAKPNGYLSIDGLCGPATINWILRFQLDVRASGHSVYADKRADRCRNAGGVGSITGTVYTILWLNHALKSYDRAAFNMIPQQVPLTPVGSVPPPGVDWVTPPPLVVPETGGG
ncbi:MAG: hypothetical protein ACRD68_05005 [Pyrinomonadaceae bacterium]